jgi:hypothetical protein
MPIKIRQRSKRVEANHLADMSGLGAPDPVRCTISGGIAIIRCALTGSFINYRSRIGEISDLEGHQDGMPILLDITESPPSDVTDRVIEARVTALTRFMVSGQPLRVAVLAAAADVARVRRALHPLWRICIVTEVFTQTADAHSWLVSTPGDSRRRSDDEGL